MGMLHAAIDIHTRVFQAAVLDPASGEIAEARFPATREALHKWAMPLPGTVGHALAEETGLEPAPQTAHAAQVDAVLVDWFRRHLNRTI